VPTVIEHITRYTETNNCNKHNDIPNKRNRVEIVKNEDEQGRHLSSQRFFWCRTDEHNIINYYYAWNWGLPGGVVWLSKYEGWSPRKRRYHFDIIWCILIGTWITIHWLYNWIQISSFHLHFMEAPHKKRKYLMMTPSHSWYYRIGKRFKCDDKCRYYLVSRKICI